MVDTAIAFVRFVVGWMFTLLMSAGCCVFMLFGFPAQGWIFWCRPWARGALKIIDVRLHIAGGQNLAGPAVFASNHQSLIDVVFLPAILPRTVRWVAKKELRKIPFWGPALGSCAVMIDRRNPKAAIESIKEGVADLPADWSVVLFPEGTRSKDGHMLRFKRGVFHIGMQSRLPIVPIGIHGARSIVPKDSWLVRPGDVDITIGDPINTDFWELESIDAHMAEVRAAVEDCVQTSRRRWEARHAQKHGAEAGPLGAAV